MLHGNGSITRSISTRRRMRRRAATIVVAATAALSLAALVLSAPAGAVVAPVNLGTAATYSVLGGSTVTNTGPSTLSADLGVDPGTATTGFPPGLVAGATHKGDAVALQAKSDLTAAYTDAAGRTPTASVAGDLVGKTEPAGVYKSTGPLALSGTLTLNGQGDPSSVFIFQVASTLITASASYVNMINGAQACNVFWQVGSSATLGTHSVFRGTIMALTSISVTTGVVVQGQALARNGAVTLNDDVFTGPGCSTPSSTNSTTTTVTGSPNALKAGGTTTLTATVAGTGFTHTGTVTFSQNGVAVGTSNVGPTGHATLTLPVGSTVGSRTITAKFNGNATSSPSVSIPTSVVVVGLTVVPTVVSAVVPILPDTGPAQVVALTGTAAALLTLGLGSLWIARRRRGSIRLAS
jgi:hypothetical protein